MTARTRGYPREYESTAVLRDGRSVTIRPVRASDAPLVRQAIAEADPETLHRRFMGGPPHSDAAIRHLVELDYDRRFAVAAFDPAGKGVAIARYEGQAGRDDAEVAVAVAPEWRGQGLATHLLGVLGKRALECGITSFWFTYLAGNRDVHDLIAWARLPTEQRQEGADVEGSVTLPPSVELVR